MIYFLFKWLIKTSLFLNWQDVDKFNCSEQSWVAMHGFSRDSVWSEWYGGGLIERNVLKMPYNFHKLCSFKPHMHRNLNNPYFLYLKRISTVLFLFKGKK